MNCAKANFQLQSFILGLLQRSFAEFDDPYYILVASQPKNILGGAIKGTPRGNANDLKTEALDGRAEQDFVGLMLTFFILFI